MQMNEHFEVFNIIQTLYSESCPSVTRSDVECPGQDTCWHAHTVGQFRRPLFNDQGDLAYWPVPCGRSQTIPAAGIKNCHNGNKCTLAHSNNEVNYHPLTFKTTACSKTKNKCSNAFCPFYHKKSERRELKYFFKKSVSGSCDYQYSSSLSSEVSMRMLPQPNVFGSFSSASEM